MRIASHVGETTERGGVDPRDLFMRRCLMRTRRRLNQPMAAPGEEMTVAEWVRVISPTN